jgi:hypothetical protein
MHARGLKSKSVLLMTLGYGPCKSKLQKEYAACAEGKH